MVIDTDILIDTSRGVEYAIDFLSDLESQFELSISVVTQMELIVGCRNKAELHNLAKFLKRFRVIKLDRNISDQTVSLLTEYRLSHGLLIPDALIAATAITWTYPLVSKNQRDYRFITDLDLMPYP
ncbi:MAG TPA: type II toxin-antitoxin system VapC family toxin [Chloroflexi bacterium]|nr:type II toxin-antitoxin system VapC family toxin [Chloroflexota bacterium]